MFCDGWSTEYQEWYSMEEIFWIYERWRGNMCFVGVGVGSGFYSR